MANYVSQDISGLNLSNQNLTGADFTNANATNVNFTNAIITSAIFKNTLITGATLTGITFSNVQKGHLLLRAANHTNTAVNNLTALTPAEFRIIQPAVGTDTIARISTVTVKIPNSQGEGYTVSVTPVISQLVCIFAATSQNIIITTGGTQIRTIRSNGTVVQDVSNGNTTINYLKIDSISYRLTVGNGDGVIAMIPVDLNVYQVNGSGLGDIVSLNVGSASTTLNMNNNGITNVSSIQGWNVKEITAGTGIGVTATNGSYAITNSAVVRDISAGTGITVSTAGGVATITNSAVVRDISAGTGITVSKTGGVATLQNSGILSVGAASGTPGITVSTASGVATFQNTGILSVSAASGTPGITVSTASGVATLQNTGILSVASGTGISVGTSNGIATITNTGPTQVAVAQTIRDENQALLEIGALPRKPDYWATNWSIADNTARYHNDMYVSVDGKIIASASSVNASTGFIRYSTDYGTTFGDGNVSLNWQTICGTSQGSRIFAISSTFGSANSTALWQSTTQGATWTQISSPGFASDAYIHRMRCSGDGTYLTATDLTASNNGRYYTSSNSGTTWTARTLSASAGYTNSVCFSRSGSIQYITWIASGNTSSAIYRSFDYGVTFTLVQGHIADGGYWRRIECDAMGRFVYATRLNTITSQLYVYRSDDYGTTWAQFNAPGYEDVWVSATGQFVVMVSNAWTWNLAPYNGVIVVYSRDYGRQDTFSIFNLGQTSTIQNINGSGDGSVLVLGSLSITQSGFAGDGKIRIARQGQQNIQDLSVVGGTIVKASGTYTLTNDVVLWYSATPYFTSQGTYNLTWPTTSKIDLTQFNIRYEIDINFDYLLNQSNNNSYIQLGLNEATSTSGAGESGAKVHSVTNWTNIVNNGTSIGAADEFNQTYRNRFYCGYRPPSTWNTDYRNRLRLSGEISYNRRIASDPGISPDYSSNSREILNKFNCDHSVVTKSDANNTEWYVYSLAGIDQIEGHQRIHGTSIWNASGGNLWTANEGTNTALSQGVYNISLAFQDLTTTTTTYARGAEVNIRIYRVRK